MFYCNPGQMLVVNAFYGEGFKKMFTETKVEPRVWVILSGGSGKTIHIPHGDLVMALEKSVPPWHTSDVIRCLWQTKEVHIRRIVLEHCDKINQAPTEDH